jgi:hypothetical protein
MEKQIFVFRRFAHRRNADASFDSICLACFLTVGSALVNEALQDLESDHHCGPWGLDSYRNAPGRVLRSRLPIPGGQGGSPAHLHPICCYRGARFGGGACAPHC